MSSPAQGRAQARRRLIVPALRLPRWQRSDLRALGRRLAHFWIVWTMLLLVHEGGHALAGWRQGLEVRRVTVGVGPAIWRGTIRGTETVVRLVPIVGMTSTRVPRAAGPTGSHRDAAHPAQSWSAEITRLAGGVLATLAVAILVSVLVAGLERASGARWVWGRMLVADALVLTVFNLLPVPPLDGGRAVIVAVVAMRDAPLSTEALLWLQLGGLAVAIVPMMLWTSWTARIDRVAMRLGAPVR